MSTQTKRRRASCCTPIDPRQQDLFAGWPAPPPWDLPATFAARSDTAACDFQRDAVAPATSVTPPEKSAPRVRKVQATKTPLPVKSPPPALGGEDWWTTRSVCVFLKIGRKALWNMRRDPASDFPAPVDAVGHRHLYLAAEVRAWMEAQRETARQRVEQRRRAMGQFLGRSP